MLSIFEIVPAIFSSLTGTVVSHGAHSLCPGGPQHIIIDPLLIWFLQWHPSRLFQGTNLISLLFFPKLWDMKSPYPTISTSYLLQLLPPPVPLHTVPLSFFYSPPKSCPFILCHQPVPSLPTSNTRCVGWAPLTLSIPSSSLTFCPTSGFSAISCLSTLVTCGRPYM